MDFTKEELKIISAALHSVMASSWAYVPDRDFIARVDRVRVKAYQMANEELVVSEG